MKITIKQTVEHELNFDTPTFRVSSIKAVAIFEDISIAVTRIKWMTGTETSRIEVEPIDKTETLPATSTAGRALLEADYKETTAEEFLRWMHEAQSTISVELHKIAEL